jgi:hypothetical protein
MSTRFTESRHPPDRDVSHKDAIASGMERVLAVLREARRDQDVRNAWGVVHRRCGDGEWGCGPRDRHGTTAQCSRPGPHSPRCDLAVPPSTRQWRAESASSRNEVAERSVKKV